MTTRFDDFSQEVRRERELPISAPEAWPLIATERGLATWLADEVSLDVAAGARGSVIENGDRREVVVESVEEGRRVSLRWWSEDAPASLVDLVVEPLDAERCRLVVVELPLQAIALPAAPPQWLSTRPSNGPQLAAVCGAGSQ